MKVTLTTDLAEVLEKKVSQFQRKFDKYGQGQIIYTKSEPYICEEQGERYGYKVVDIEVEGSYKVGEYEFVASLDFDQATGMNIVSKVPGMDDIPAMYVTRCECDHCHSHKTSRLHTVLLRSTVTGEFVQVGKTCLHDYLGRSIGNYAAFLNLFADLEQYIAEACSKKGIGRGYRAYEVEEILVQTIVDARTRGYISKAAVRAWYDKNDPEGEYDMACPFTTTASRICTMFAEVEDAKGHLAVPKYKEFTEQDKQQVSDVIAYVNEHKDEGDYMRNLYILLNSKWVEFDRIGLVASAVGTFLRETIKKQEQVTQQEASDFVGEVGDKVEFTAKPEVVFSTDSQFGMYYIYKFVVNGKDIIIWKTNKCLRPDTEVTFKATIKDHSEFKGTKQTEITRARIAG